MSETQSKHGSVDRDLSDSNTQAPVAGAPHVKPEIELVYYDGSISAKGHARRANQRRARLAADIERHLKVINDADPQAVDLKQSNHSDQGAVLHNFKNKAESQYEQTHAATDGRTYDSGYGTVSQGALDTQNRDRRTKHTETDFVGIAAEGQHYPQSLSDDGSLPDRADGFASNIANELLAELRTVFTTQNWATVREALPDRLRDFAIRIGSQGATQLHRDVMWVAHNAALAIVQAIEGGVVDVGLVDDEEECINPASDNPLDLHEKIKYLTTRPEISYPRDDEDVNLPLIEIEPYHQVLHTSDAFLWLLSMIQQDIKLAAGKSLTMQGIRDAIVGPFYDPSRRISRWRKPQIIKMNFIVDCNPIAFVAEQLHEEPLERALRRVITLTRNEIAVQALPCLEYMEQTWPSTGPQMLRHIEQAIGQPRGRHSESLNDGTKLETFIEGELLHIKTEGVICSIVEIGQQLAWLGAALQHPPKSGGSSCQAIATLTDIRQEPTSDGTPDLSASAICRINFHTTPFDKLGSEEYGNCWYTLFQAFVVVEGYPVLKRPQGSFGLEIPLDMAAALTYAPRVVEFKGSLCMKGFSTLLYPTKFTDDIVLWHLIHNQDGRRIAYSDKRVDIGNSAVGQLRYSDLAHTRHIVGWCDKVANYTGGPHANLNIQPSGLSRPSSGWALEKVTISGGKYIIGGGTFALAKKDKALCVTRENLDYVSKIEWINGKSVVLHDVSDRIAWLVDGTSALLHLVRKSLDKDSKGDFRHLWLFEPGSLREADPDVHDGEDFTARMAAITVLTNEANLKLPLRRKLGTGTPDGKDDYYSFQNRVDDVFHILEQIIDHQEDMRADGVGLRIRTSPWRRLEGFDFIDIAHRDREPFNPKKISLMDDGKGWYCFVREINAVVLFGTGFGDLLQPKVGSGSCSSCLWNAPAVKGKDLLAAPVSDIKRLVEGNQDSSGQSQRCWLLRGGLRWDVPGQAFRACCCSGSGPIFIRIQVLHTHADAKERRQRDTICSSNVCEDGAVLFGHVQNVLRKPQTASKIGSEGIPSHRSGSVVDKNTAEIDESVDTSRSTSRQTSVVCSGQPLSTESNTSSSPDSKNSGRSIPHSFLRILNPSRPIDSSQPQSEVEMRGPSDVRDQLGDVYNLTQGELQNMHRQRRAQRRAARGKQE